MQDPEPEPLQSSGGVMEHDRSHADQRRDGCTAYGMVQTSSATRFDLSLRGSQYCSHEFQSELKGFEIKASMSRNGNCWDNAPTESL